MSPAVDYGLELLPQHTALLAASMIVPDVASARGYRSVTRKVDLARAGFPESQRIVPTLLIPVYNVRGELALYQHRPDAPRIRDGKPVKYETIAGARMVVDVPPAARINLGAPAVDLFITEGIRKADALVSHGLCAIDLLGVWNWRGTNGVGGKTALPDWELIALNNGRRVLLVFDSDVMTKVAVYAALERLADFLKSRGAHVLYIYLPHSATGKCGVDDYLGAGHTIDDVMALATTTLRRPPQDHGDLRAIDASDRDLPRVSAAAWDALKAANEPPKLFCVGHQVARLEPDDTLLGVRILNVDKLRHHVARAARWYRETKDGRVPAVPPEDVIRDMLAEPTPQLPPLERIIGAPVFAHDGRLVHLPGYDESTRLYYAPASGLVVPAVGDQPTADDLAKAKARLLDDLLVDFPFTGDAERAHALALSLLPFVRELIDGPTPFHLIEKPTPGTGAGLLVRALLFPALGGPPALMTEGRNEEEWRKRLTAKMVNAPAAIVIDNLRGRLDSAALSAAITAPVWEDRILGRTEMVRARPRCAWVATANNAALSNEMSRRAIRIRLDAKRDRPWLREGFKHPELLEWAKGHRGELIWAALTLAQAWLAAGRPAGGGVLGEFENWARVMGGILGNAEIKGFLGNLSEFYEATDAEGAETRSLVSAWWQKHQSAEVGVSELFDLVTSAEVGLDLPSKTERGQRTQLGQRLAAMRDRRYTVVAGAEGGKEIIVCVTAAHPHQGAGRWRLAPDGERFTRFTDSADATEINRFSCEPHHSTSEYLPQLLPGEPVNLENLGRQYEPLDSDSELKRGDG